MTKQKRNKVIAVVAVLLMIVAAFLTVMLFVVDNGSDKKSDTGASVTVAEGSGNGEIQSTTFAPAKYLWEYGPDASKAEKTSVLK